MLRNTVHFIYELFLVRCMDRHLLITIMMGLMLLPQVHAIGVATFDDYSAGFEMDQGDEIDLEFVLRGDEIDHDDVAFFIYSENNALEFNGDTYYERQYNLDEYEDVNIDVEMYAVKDGEYDVSYGYFIDPADDEFGIRTVVENSFEVEIGYVEEEDDDFNVLVNGTDESNVGSGRRGGGGGGGAYIPPEEVEEKEFVNGLWFNNETGMYEDENGNEFDEAYARQIIDGVEEQPEVQEVIAQDISAQGSATNEIVVDPETGGTPEPTFTVASTAEGKEFMLVVLIIGFVAVLATFGAATYVNREGSE